MITTKNLSERKGRKTGRRTIKPEILVRYKRMIEREKEKTWIAKDFSSGTKTARIYLKTLKGLGIIEEVDAYYKTGRNKGSRKSIHGYRMVKK